MCHLNLGYRHLLFPAVNVFQEMRRTPVALQRLFILRRTGMRNMHQIMRAAISLLLRYRTGCNSCNLLLIIKLKVKCFKVIKSHNWGVLIDKSLLSLPTTWKIVFVSCCYADSTHLFYCTIPGSLTFYVWIYFFLWSPWW